MEPNEPKATICRGEIDKTAWEKKMVGQFELRCCKTSCLVLLNVVKFMKAVAIIGQI